MSNEVNTGKILKLIETANIHNVPFNAGQFIIVDNGMMYYDSTVGTSMEDRICLTPKQEVDVYIRENNLSDEYYLSLHTDPLMGDIVIIKDLINGTNKYSFTIYLYNNNMEDNNNNEWVKLTDSVNASNIYFDKDITIGIELPGIELVDGQHIVNSTGKNLYEVFNSIFHPEKNPNIVKPSISISFPEAGCYELGTTITPTYEITFNPGEYEFGPLTNVYATEYKITTSTGDNSSLPKSQFESLVVDENTDFYITAIVVHSAGSIPHTNRHNDYVDGQIQINAVANVSSHITGYLNGLYYGVSNEVITEQNITSDLIRSLNKTNKSYDTEDINLTVPIGTKSIIIACPSTETGIIKVFNNTSYCDMYTAFGQPTVVNILDANNSSLCSKDYNVWIYTPAEPYEIPAELTITRG